jgi:hypothetical protein
MAGNNLSEVSAIVRQTRRNPQRLHQIVFGDGSDGSGIPDSWTGSSPEYAVAVLLGYDG